MAGALEGLSLLLVGHARGEPDRRDARLLHDREMHPRRRPKGAILEQAGRVEATAGVDREGGRAPGALQQEHDRLRLAIVHDEHGHRPGVAFGFIGRPLVRRCFVNEAQRGRSGSRGTGSLGRRGATGRDDDDGRKVRHRPYEQESHGRSIGRVGLARA
jgi:hypothetical protein